MRSWPAYGLAVLLCCSTVSTAQSLGDVARQERARKSLNPHPERHVFTNEDFSRAKQEEPASSPSQPDSKSAEPGADGRDKQARELQSNIRAQKQKVWQLDGKVREIQRQLEAREPLKGMEVSQRISLLSSGGMGYKGQTLCSMAYTLSDPSYQKWCDEANKLSAELDKTNVELKQARAVLEALQEQARRLGYGNAFYDAE